MDLADAIERAEETLGQFERDSQPLALLDPEDPVEHEWCWLFAFNAVRALETGDLMDSLATGPIVVPKNGAEPWIAPSSPPVERWLNEYAAREGLPPVPVPAMPDPFA